MNSIAKANIKLLSRNKPLFVSFLRNAAAWNRDWKPGPYPKTQAEREAAAKKYGLHIRDYKPYPDDGFGWGDYPMFEPQGVDSKDPYEHYDMPEFRRNYGELLHPDFEMYTADRYSDWPSPYSFWYHFRWFLGVLSLVIGSKIIGEQFSFIRPIMFPETQRPGDGKVHYSFDPSH